MGTMTSREFNQDTGRAKRSANQAPLVITDRGEPAYVLLRHDTYLALLGERPGIRGLLDISDIAGDVEVDFEPPKLDGSWYRAATLD